MSNVGRGSIVRASVWMLVITLLLFWLPFVGPLLGGVVGGRKAGGVGRAIMAALVPAFVTAVLLFVLATMLTAIAVDRGGSGVRRVRAGRSTGRADDPRRHPRGPDGLTLARGNPAPPTVHRVGARPLPFPARWGGGTGGVACSRPRRLIAGSVPSAATR
jgi:hypothetical protein